MAMINKVWVWVSIGLSVGAIALSFTVWSNGRNTPTHTHPTYFRYPELKTIPTPFKYPEFEISMPTPGYPKFNER